MKASELDLDQLLARHPEDGTLDLPLDRVVLVDAAASGRLAEELAAELGPEVAKGILTRHGFASGHHDAARLRDLFAWESDEEWLRAAARTRTILGGGHLRFDELDVDRATGRFLVRATVRNALEACECRRRRGRAEGPVCHQLTGYLSGYASAFMGADAVFLERSCAASAGGDRVCRFEGRLASDWELEGEDPRASERAPAERRSTSRHRQVLELAVKVREQELELSAQRKFEEASRLKSEFLANISHELRTPLNSIIGYADLLQTKIGRKLPPTPRKNLDRILHNAEHLLSLINSILDISKIEAGRLDLYMEPVDVEPILASCLKDTEVLLEGKPVKLVRAYDPVDLLPVRVDKLRLKQCFINVLSNAAKFTDEGSIKVEVRHLKARKGGKTIPYLCIAVSDTGPGIAPEHQALIFEPFRQVDASATRRHDGTGLGLPIVRQLLALMGGEIHVQSALNQGSTFTMVVPIADEELTPFEGTKRPTGEEGAEPERPAELLLIDDDPDSVARVREQLSQAIVRELISGGPARLPKLSLRCEEDPIKGIAAARLEAPTVILLDLRLPLVDGREVLKLVREDVRTREVPVIVLAQPEDVNSPLTAGAFAVLQKPVDADSLIGTIVQAVSVGSSRA